MNFIKKHSTRIFPVQLEVRWVSTPILLVLGLLLGSVSLSAQDLRAEEVLIVVNRDDPDSLAIGQHYATARGIPKTNIIELSTPTEETISIAQYVETIANPLLDAMLENEWVRGVKESSQDPFGRDRLAVSIHNVPYVVLIRGIPLRIANDPALIEANNGNIPEQFRVNNGSVDGEVALLLAPREISMTALVPNPYFGQGYVKESDANRILRVSRLDGPTKESVFNLIDRSLEAEKTGLMGRAYIDMGGPHEKGDMWIREAGELAKAAYFDTDFHTERRRMDYRERLDAPAIYIGWYASKAYAQWRSPRWPVPPGAIGFHLHSFSATSVRDPSTWLGAFVTQGYCATMGNVYEPYLEYTHRPQILLAHLLDGGTFGEAVMRSMPALSWQSVAIGDPLFRPFKVGLDAQLEESQASRFAGYASIREVNRLLAAGDRASAIRFARSKFVDQPSLALAYQLGRIYSQEQKSREAVEVLKVIRYMTSYSEDEYVLVQQIADLLHELEESDLALKLYQNLLDERNLRKPLKIALYEGGARIAASQGQSNLASRWELGAQRLKSPPQSN